MKSSSVFNSPLPTLHFSNDYQLLPRISPPCQVQAAKKLFTEPAMAFGLACGAWVADAMLTTRVEPSHIIVGRPATEVV